MLSAHPAHRHRRYAGARMDMQVDNDSAGVLVDVTDGATRVVADDPDTSADESTSDTYSVRLTKAPTQDVTIRSCRTKPGRPRCRRR